MRVLDYKRGIGTATWRDRVKDGPLTMLAGIVFVMNAWSILDVAVGLDAYGWARTLLVEAMLVLVGVIVGNMSVRALGIRFAEYRIRRRRALEPPAQGGGEKAGG